MLVTRSLTPPSAAELWTSFHALPPNSLKQFLKARRLWRWQFILYDDHERPWKINSKLQKADPLALGYKRLTWGWWKQNSWNHIDEKINIGFVLFFCPQTLKHYWMAISLCSIFHFQQWNIFNILKIWKDLTDLGTQKYADHSHFMAGAQHLYFPLIHTQNGAAYRCCWALEQRATVCI